MRVLCRFGHFAFYPDSADEIGEFSAYFDTELVLVDDYYTFEALEEAPHYSLPAKPYLGLPAVSLYEGKPWEVMRENGFVYSIALGMLVPKLTIISIVTLPQSGFVFTMGGFIQPGSRTVSGSRIMSYDCELVQSSQQWRVSRVIYE